MRCSIPRSRPPVTTSGGWPSVVLTVAPIRRSGAATRSIGRAVRLRSPVSSVVNGAAARIPARRRIEVPELPQSRPARGWMSPSRPSPSTSSVPFGTPRGVSFHVEPPPSTPDEAFRAHRSRAGRAFSVSSARHEAVDRTSRAPGRPVKRLRLEAVHARISQRWAMDLSPGTRTVPWSRPPGITRIRMAQPRPTGSDHTRRRRARRRPPPPRPPLR